MFHDGSRGFPKVRFAHRTLRLLVSDIRDVERRKRDVEIGGYGEPDAGQECRIKVHRSSPPGTVVIA
jgi:hypothetical protein